MLFKVDVDIYVFGDVFSQGDMLKLGYFVNLQVKVCVNVVCGVLIGFCVFLVKFVNICWFLIVLNDGVKVGVIYEVMLEKIVKVDGFIFQMGESVDLCKVIYEELEGWYIGIIIDMFG